MSLPVSFLRCVISYDLMLSLSLHFLPNQVLHTQEEVLMGLMQELCLD